MNQPTERIIDRYEDERQIGTHGYYDETLGQFVATSLVMQRTVKIADVQGRVRLATAVYHKEGHRE